MRRLLPEPGPGRVLVLSSLVASVGHGLYVAGSVIYFVRYVGLSAVEVGVGLSVGGIAGLVVGPFLGHLADRIGPRTATIAHTVVQVVALVAAGLVGSFWPFLAVITVLGVAEAGEAVSRGALVSGVMGREGRVRISAYLRSVFNLGFTVGVFLAGLALAADTRPAYLALIWGHAAILLVVAVMNVALPHVPGIRPEPGDTAPRLPALRDLPYFAVAQVAGLTRLGETVFTIALPLWIVSHTNAPRAMAAWIVGVNTILIVLLQVRTARSAETLDGAARIQQWSFIILAVSCAVAGVTSALPAWGTVAVLLVVVVGMSFGEMWGEGARWALRFELAPANAQGQYGGVFRLSQFIPAAAGPVLVTGLTDRLEYLGWLIIASIFVVGLALNRTVIAWAVRTREPSPADAVPAPAVP